MRVQLLTKKVATKSARMLSNRYLRIAIGVFLISMMASGVLSGSYMTTSADIVTATPVSASPSGPVAGWASQTHFHDAETLLQRTITTNLRDFLQGAAYASWGSSGQSSIVPGATWETDTAQGDGARMKAAISHYDQWYRTRTPTLSSVRNTMVQDFAGSAYTTQQKNQWVDHIMDSYAIAAQKGKVTVPTDDNGVLAFLAIRKQCLEFAVTYAMTVATSLKLKTSYRGYSSPAVTDPTAYRPGMALFRLNKSHAMIIVDIQWDAKGNPVQVKVAEANYGSDWTNPSGMVPWQRIFVVGRIEPLQGNKVVNFE